MAEVYSTQIVTRLGQVVEDVQRIYKRCREIGDELHEEILRILHELHTTMKTYHGYQSEMRAAEMKLRLAEGQRQKVELSTPAEKLPRLKKYRLIEKEVQKRKSKFNDASLNALKARNEYVLCLEAANNTVHKYFVDDLSDLIDCMDFGFHQCISRALLMHVNAEEGRQRSSQLQNEQLSSCINALDSRLDKQRFLESNHTAFVIPKKFELRGDEPAINVDVELLPSLRDELTARLQHLNNRIMNLRTESEEVWKTLETAETSLLAMLEAKEFECASLFSGNADSTPNTLPKPPETVAFKLRADRRETEEFYLTKFREYLLGTSRISRLEAKREHIQHTLQDSLVGGPPSLNLNLISSNHNHAPGQPASSKPVRRKRIGRPQTNGHSKLFGGSLEEYLEMSEQDIPLILKSCIRVINLYGLHHQGIFRVSGAQVEINNFQEAFERGEDPLSDMTDASDINSVAGVLKLYLRKLREPLFPIVHIDLFMDLAQLESKHEFVVKMRDLVMSLPRLNIVVLRYLFAFLNHLSDFSDENMMDPYNLAICFGPTLVRVPKDQEDQLQYQNQINELVKNIILFHEDIFPPTSSIPGPLYEKFLSREPDDNDVGDSPSDHAQEDLDSEVYPSEDECESLEAVAQFDFHARSERELSFKKGDNLQLYTQVSNDWWRGRGTQGSEGLIPDKYILLKMKDEDREKFELLKSSSSDESMRRRASSSNDSVLSGASGSTQNDSPLFGTGNSSTWPGIAGLVGRSPTLTTCEPPPPPLLSPTAEDALGVVHKSVSCTSLDSGKESASDDQLQRADTTDSTERIAEPLDNFQSSSPLSPDSGASGSSESPPTEAAAVLPSARKSEEQATDQLLTTAALRTEQNATSDKEDPTRKFHVKSHSMSEPSSEQPVSVHRRSNSSDANNEVWELSQKQTPDLVLDLPRRLSVDSAKEESDDSSSVGPDSPDMTTTAERFAKQNQCTLKKNTKAGSLARGNNTGNSTSSETHSAANGEAPPGAQAAATASGSSTPQRPPIAAKPPLKAKPQILKKTAIPSQLNKEEDPSVKTRPDQCDNQ